MKRLTFTAIAAACLLAAPGMTMATNLLVITNTGYGGYGYGHAKWSGFTGDINAAIAASGGTVTTASALDAGALGHDALMLDQRWQAPSLPAAEQAILASFMATGRRVFLVGENNFWTGWNSSILSLAGGSYASGFTNNAVTPATNHPLATGVSSITLVNAGLAVGGTPLFTENFATLWGAGNNVLSVLDINLFTDSAANNSTLQFRTNIATWIAAPVPEPETYAMMIAGLGVIGLAMRRNQETRGQAS